MKRKISIVTGILLLILAGGMVIWTVLSGKPDPVYRGRRVSAWVNGLGNDKGYSELMTDKVRWADPMTVAILTQALDKKDSGFQKVYQRIWPKLPQWVRTNISEPTVGANIRLYGAIGLDNKGRYYKPAVPKLIRLVANDEDANVRIFAIIALGTCLESRPSREIEDVNETAAAARALSDALQDSNPFVRTKAAEVLEKIGHRADKSRAMGK